MFRETIWLNVYTATRRCVLYWPKNILSIFWGYKNIGGSTKWYQREESYHYIKDSGDLSEKDKIKNEK